MIFTLMIPIISGICYLVGGQWWKPARWFMGVPIWLLASDWNSWFFIPYPELSWMILAIPAYWIVTSAFPYGENSWLNFLGEYGKFAICGLVFGLASISVVGLLLGIVQGIIAAISFVIIKWADSKGYIGNPLVEIARGVSGTIVFLIA